MGARRLEARTRTTRSIGAGESWLAVGNSHPATSSTTDAVIGSGASYEDGITDETIFLFLRDVDAEMTRQLLDQVLANVQRRAASVGWA
jgi:hypothetical protein